MHPVALDGVRIRLRELTVADAAAAFAWASDPAFFRYMATEAVPSEDEERTFLRTVEASACADPRVDYILGVVERASDALVGIVRVSVKEPEQRGGDLGYGLRTDRWGRGYATEAASLLVGFAFTQLGLHRVWAFCDPRNHASRRVLEKIGMRREGHIRENMLAHGAWRDSLVFAVLEHEWQREPSVSDRQGGK